MIRRLFAAILLLVPATTWGAVELFPPAPQFAAVGVEFAPIRVRVTDDAGQPAAGAALGFNLPFAYLGTGLFVVRAAQSGWSCISDLGTQCRATTDAQGEASLPGFYATTPGTFPLTLGAASAGGQSLGSATATYVAEALTAVPQLLAHDGNRQSVVQGRRLEPFIVRFVDALGRPIAGAEVSFSASNGAWIVADTGSSYATATTDADGYARSPAYLATQALGDGRVVASARAPGSYLSQNTTFEYRVTTQSGATSVNLQDMWWAGERESGWAISVAQDGRILFPLVYAYDAAGEPTWYVGLNDFQSSPFFSTAYYRYHFDAYSPRSAPYYAYDARRFQLGRPVMGLHLSFESPSNLQLTVQEPGRDNLVKQLVRMDFTTPVPAPLTGLGGMWWGGPDQNGWGISVMEQAGGFFAVWATYGDDGRPTWFVMDVGSWTSDRTWEGRMVRASGPRWPDFDTSRLRLEDVGTFRFDFHDRMRATFTWTIGARRGVVPIERMPL
jgi:hypothetical protein